MRILFCGVAAIALSGCSWMGFGTGTSGSTASTGQYSYAKDKSDCCVGGQTLSRWNIEADTGVEFLVGGDAITGDQTHPGVVAPTTSINNVSMNDAYDMGYRASLGGSYALNPNRKITGQAFFARADGNEVNWGTQGVNTLRGTMSDYKSYGVEAGVRQYFQPRNVAVLNSVRPYVEGKLGIAHVGAISMNNIRESGVANPSTPSSLNMYEGSWVPMAAGLVGIETPVFDRFTVGVETGLRYAGKPESDNSSVLSGFNGRYAGFNNGGNRLSVPLTIRSRYRF